MHLFKQKNIFTLCFFFAICGSIFSQTVKINSSQFYEDGIDSNSHYFKFKLIGDISNKELVVFKTKSLKYNFVIDFISAETADGYDIKVLLDKKSEDIPHYYSKYFETLSFIEIIVDTDVIKASDFAKYLTAKYTKAEKINN